MELKLIMMKLDEGGSQSYSIIIEYNIILSLMLQYNGI